MDSRPTLAIIIPGGIGVHDHIPTLLDLLYRIAGSFNVFIYSFDPQPPHPSIPSEARSIIFAPPIFKSRVSKTLYFLWRIRKDYKQKHFLLIHGFWVVPQGIAAVLLGKYLNIPSVVTLPGGDITYIPEIHYGSFSNSLNKILIRWCIHQASRVVLLTHFQQSVMQGNGILRDEISIIPYGVNVQKYSFQPRPFSPPLDLCFIGNLNRVKDPFTALKVLCLLSKKYDCRLTMAGSDILNGEVQVYARELGIYEMIRWMGKLSYEKIPEVLSTANVLLLTSKYEGQAVVVLEAYASGVVVVGTNVGLLADIGDDQLLALPGDAAGLADRINDLIKHPEKIYNLQTKNRLYAESLSAEWTFNEYNKLYHSLSG